MNEGQSPVSSSAAESFQKLLRAFKERLAQHVWRLPSVSETEKELLFRNCLADLDAFETSVSLFHEEVKTHQKLSTDENDLLRSLLGIPGDELKTRALSLGHDLTRAKKEIEELKEERAATLSKTQTLEDENAVLRQRLQGLEKKADQTRVEQLKIREQDIKLFSESHEKLKDQLKDLEARLSNLRELFNKTNQQFLSEKQEEISLLQRKLLDDMETTLRHRQELLLAEEEMFAKGLAQRVRQTLVALQGQLFLTLERMGFLDPETKTESFWKARLRLLMDGAQELAENFRAVQAHLLEVTQTLDDYLRLTHRRELLREPVSLKELVQKEMAEIFAERRPTLSVECLSDDPLPTVQGDPTLLQFVVRALLQNALEALVNESGQIVIALKNRQDKGLLEMVVRDSGKGIPDHLKTAIFQPFFTTKDHHHGLSLSRAKRYVELYGGHLELRESGAEGTLFQMQLPLNVQAATALARYKMAS